MNNTSDSIRQNVERVLRVTGTFRATKRTIQRVQTTAMQAVTSYKRMAHSKTWPDQRRGNTVMFHTGRSGSSVVADLLARHPDIFWDGELFNYDLLVWRERMRPRLKQAGKTIGSRINYANVPIYGFEVLSTQLQAGLIDTREFVSMLDDFGVRQFILLTRRNILRKIVSNLVARERGRWRLKMGETAPMTRIFIDPENVRLACTKPLVEHIRDFREDYRALEETLGNRRTLQLVYEDDIAGDPRCAYRRICEFLNLAQVDLSVRHTRTTPQPLRDVIRNYNEVEMAIADTEFAWMLNEEEIL